MIRKAGVADVSRIGAIVAQAYAPLATRMERPPAPMLEDYAVRVAEGVVDVWDDGSLLGMIILVDRSDTLLLENVAVAPEAQGLGIGRRLIAHAEAEAQARGHWAVRLYTHATMVENQALYRRLGYIEIGQGLEDGYDRVQFEKQLGAKT